MYGVIDPDVLWSCTTCGACVNQCPVDIEHVDHIVDMRRYQVLVESNFPGELNQLFRGLEGRGNPWNMSPQGRMDWAKGLDFEVPVVGEDLESMESVDWLFWIGCAGAYEDRAKKTVRAVAELLHLADISFGVLGNGETCTGDPARRAGNEFVYQGLAAQNIETLREHRVKQVVTTCPHCLNTLKNEYRDLGLELDVVHHTQLLNRLVREGRLTPVARRAPAPRSARSPTTTPATWVGTTRSTPRRASCSQVLPGASYVEMERSAERSFCCGAGGARMWMEENLGERINVNRTQEAVGTGADQIAVGCPFCRVMLSDGLTAEQADGRAREEVEVLDVAQMLLASVKGEVATRAGRAARRRSSLSRPPRRSEETRAEPEPGDVTQSTETVTATEDVGPAAAAAAPRAGPCSTSAPTSRPEPAPPSVEPVETTSRDPGSGSLFDLGADEEPAPRAASPRRSSPSRPRRRADLGSGSLFDLGTDESPQSTEPAETAARRSSPSRPRQPETDLGSGSLFDLGADEEPDPVGRACRDHGHDAGPESPSRRRPSRGPTSTSTRAGRSSTCDIALTCDDAA